MRLATEATVDLRSPVALPLTGVNGPVRHPQCSMSEGVYSWQLEILRSPVALPLTDVNGSGWFDAHIISIRACQQLETGEVGDSCPTNRTGSTPELLNIRVRRSWRSQLRLDGHGRNWMNGRLMSGDRSRCDVREASISEYVTVGFANCGWTGKTGGLTSSVAWPLIGVNGSS